MFNFQGSVRCVVTALILYHIHSSLSSTFWKYFLFSFYLIFFRLRCNFYTISHRFVFVKYFFKTFWSFLSSWFRLLRRNFYIISHLFDFVKYFFKLFEVFCTLLCLSGSPSLTALLYYHFYSWLSIVFLTFYVLFAFFNIFRDFICNYYNVTLNQYSIYTKFNFLNI